MEVKGHFRLKLALLRQEMTYPFRKVKMSLYTPWLHMGEWRYSSIHSQTSHKTEFSDQFNSPAKEHKVVNESYRRWRRFWDEIIHLGLPAIAPPFLGCPAPNVDILLHPRQPFCRLKEVSIISQIFILTGDSYAANTQTTRTDKPVLCPSFLPTYSCPFVTQFVIGESSGGSTTTH